MKDMDPLTALRLQAESVETGMKHGLWQTAEEAFAILGGEPRTETLAQAAARVMSELDEVRRAEKLVAARVWQLEQLLLNLEAAVGVAGRLDEARGLVSKAALTARKM